MPCSASRDRSLPCTSPDPLPVGSLDNGSCLVRSGLGQHRVHGSPRSCSLSLTASASFCRKRYSKRSSYSGSLRHTGARDAVILQCAGLLGTGTAPSPSGFTVIRTIAKHIAAMTNVTTLKTCFISAPRISAWRRGDASQLLRARIIWQRRVSSSC